MSVVDLRIKESQLFLIGLNTKPFKDAPMVLTLLIAPLCY